MVHKGYKQTAEHRAKIAASKRKQYEDPAEREKQRQRSSMGSHGQVGTGAYSSWGAMKQRCTNPRHRDYARYGGRGVTVCAQWMSFAGFFADMGERPPGMTLERIDNDGNYEPGNVQWANRFAQARNRSNKRLTEADVRWIRSKAETMRHKDIAAQLGVSRTYVSEIIAGKKWPAAGGGQETGTSATSSTSSVG